ncbi:MAG: hypothetical protein JXR70_00360 [Spirochaetales bacterium]|nr:hypothetical protein [Spirochaetales bacterium]
MNTKAKTILFMIIATVINILIVLALIFGGWLLFFAIVGSSVPREAGYILPGIAILALIAGFFLYNVIWKFLCKKFNINTEAELAWSAKKNTSTEDDE